MKMKKWEGRIGMLTRGWERSMKELGWRMRRKDRYTDGRMRRKDDGSTNGRMRRKDK